MYYSELEQDNDFYRVLSERTNEEEKNGLLKTAKKIGLTQEQAVSLIEKIGEKNNASDNPIGFCQSNFDLFVKYCDKKVARMKKRK